MPDYSHTNAANCDIVIDDSSDGEGGHEKRQDKVSADSYAHRTTARAAQAPYLDYNVSG